MLKNAGLFPSCYTEGYENVQVTNDYFNKIKFLELVTFFFGWLGIGCAIIDYEFRYIFEMKEELTDVRRRKLLGLLSICAFCTLATSKISTTIFTIST